MNGVECLNELRNASPLNGTVIAIFSSPEDLRDLVEASNAIYIQKPTTFSGLKTCISTLMKSPEAFKH
jgi:DNA-binding NarL/FixJ family response regulator